VANKTGNKALAAIYAEALYEAAQSANALEQVKAELVALREIIARSPKLEGMLVSPTVSFENKRKVIDTTFAKFSKITRNFLTVLVDRKRATVLDTVATEFQSLANKKAGIARVDVKSARALDAGEREKLESLLKKRLNKTIELHEHVQPELLGGLVLQHEDRLWDASVVHVLGRMVEKMEELKVMANVLKE
jgi:F-type H+-transporting ATPase subunit delta